MPNSKDPSFNKLKTTEELYNLRSYTFSKHILSSNKMFLYTHPYTLKVHKLLKHTWVDLYKMYSPSYNEKHLEYKLICKPSLT